MLEIIKDVIRWKMFKCKWKCVMEFLFVFVFYSVFNVNGVYGLGV